MYIQIRLTKRNVYSTEKEEEFRSVTFWLLCLKISLVFFPWQNYIELITSNDTFWLSITSIDTFYMWNTLLWVSDRFWTILPLIETTIVDRWWVDAWFMDGVYVDRWCVDEWWIICGQTMLMCGQTMLMCGHMMLMCFIVDNPHQKNFFFVHT